MWQVDRCDGVQVQVNQLLQQPAACCINDVHGVQGNTSKVLRNVPAVAATPATFVCIAATYAHDHQDK
jgi:hypothetical protein